MSEVSGFIKSLVNRIAPFFRRLQGERRAAKSPSDQKTEELDTVLDACINKIANISDISLLRQLISEFEIQYVVPDSLSINSLQIWLQDHTVRESLRKLVKSKLLPGAPSDHLIHDELAESFQRHTGESFEQGRKAVLAVVAIVIADWQSRINDNKFVIGLLQETHQQTTESLNYIKENVLKVPHSDQLIVTHSQECKTILNYILQCRAIPNVDAQEEIARLIERFSENGDLCHCSKSIQVDVLYWAARLYSVKAQNIQTAKNYLKKLLEIHPHFDVDIINALILEAESKTDDALRLLRGKSDPDSRATLFIVLARTRGEKAALEWYESESNHLEADFFTGIGWSNLAIVLAKLDKWEEAIRQLDVVSDNGTDWLDLAYIQGVVNAAMLLPIDLRQHAFEMSFISPAIYTHEGDKAEEFRKKAKSCFERVEVLMTEIGMQGRAGAAHDWILWLTLTDPRPEVALKAQQEIQNCMDDGKRAVELLPLAHAFGISFKDEPVRRYLANQSKIGGLSDRELIANLMLAEITLSATDLLKFIEQENVSLLNVLSISVITGITLNALIADGQIARARHLLSERKEALSDNESGRFQALILSHEGGDPRVELEEIYKQSGDLIDLRNLVVSVGRNQDWSELSPLLKDLFKRERTIENALKLIDCLKHDSNVSDTEIINFLDDNQDLMERSNDLSSAKAWALFQLGKPEDARIYNDKLLETRHEFSDVQLDLNIALETGDWERFPAIVDREWGSRDDLEPEILLRLASIAAEGDATAGRAIELAKLAAKNAPDDPVILVGAYTIAVQVGSDYDADPNWIMHAADLSAGNGPVWKADLRKLAEEMGPAHIERTNSVEANLLKGEIPIHLAATSLNIPLAQVLIGVPDRNVLEVKDGRRRVILPIISGRRQLVDIHDNWIVGIDLTSIMVFSYLGILENILTSFHKVVLASDTMVNLLAERRRVKFHQPSRVKKADEIRNLIDQGLLNSRELSNDPPRWLIDEVGTELACQLEAAKQVGELVIHPLPIFKIGTYLEKKAEIREYESNVISTIEFTRLLYVGGNIDKTKYERAKQYLLIHDKDEKVYSQNQSLDCDIFVDNLAITYLHESGLLQDMCRSGLNLFVSPQLGVEQNSLIAENREGEKLSNVLDQIRNILRESMNSGSTVLMPMSGSNGGDSVLENINRLAPTLAQFLLDTGPCDAICIDDRFLNGNAIITDRVGRSVPVLCVLDIITYLEKKKLINSDEKYDAMHRLRMAGFALVPIDEHELYNRLKDAQLSKSGDLVESKELQILRQMTMRIRSIDMLQDPVEQPYLARLRLASTMAIRRIWEDDDIDEDKAFALSTWAWTYVSPSPLDWMGEQINDKNKEILDQAFSQHVALLCAPMSTITIKRYQLLSKWLEAVVLEPLLPANSHYVNSVSILVKDYIKNISEEFSDGEH